MDQLIFSGPLVVLKLSNKRYFYLTGLTSVPPTILLVVSIPHLQARKEEYFIKWVGNRLQEETEKNTHKKKQTFEGIQSRKKIKLSHFQQ